MSKTDNTKSKRKKTVIVDKYLYLESVEENFDTGITEEEQDKMSERDKYDFMCDWCMYIVYYIIHNMCVVIE